LKNYDVVIVGGGMVGSMLAAALGRSGEVAPELSVAVLENHAPAPFVAGSEPEYDIRVSALSAATQNMLENVGAWAGVTSRRACAYREMLVWDGEAGGRTHFKASEVDRAELGHIVENRVLQLALTERLHDFHNVDYLCPARLSHIEQQSDSVVCHLASGLGAISTSLLVGADGARSTVRDLAGISIERKPYPQHALVATINTVLPQQHITWQRFQPTGPEAFLPLCGSKASMVWYHTEDEIKRLLALDNEEFISAMESSFPEELGKIDSIIERGAFPIAKAHAEQYIAGRIALVGDAAHTVHPLAGQGVNLGMLDAAALADTIFDALGNKQDPGNLRSLRKYERWRRSENSAMIAVLDGFYHAFKPQPAAVQVFRSAALNLADSAGPLKRLVMRHALGTSGHLPSLAIKDWI